MRYYDKMLCDHQCLPNDAHKVKFLQFLAFTEVY